MTGVHIIKAGALNIDHIEQLIRFRLWDDTREVATVITAELRQISHNGQETVLNYGSGAEAEAVLSPDHPVILGPDTQYFDVDDLIKADPHASP